LARDAEFFEALDRHARRRAEGHATLSILVGEQERALAVWTGWTRRRGVHVAATDSEDTREMVATWATVLARGRNLNADAEAFAGRCQRAGSRRPPHFQGKTAHERRILLDSLTPPPSSQRAWELCRWLLEVEEPSPPGVLPDAVREAIVREPTVALQALLELVPPTEAPALRLRAGPGAMKGLLILAGLCAAAPALTAACVLSPEAFEKHLRRNESHVLAMMREGRLDITAPPSLFAPGTGGRTTGTWLRQAGAPESLVSLRNELEQDLASVKDEEGRDRARSKAERFLIGVLHHHPSTRGLFAPNEPLEVDGGERTWEVDLLCRELRLAVEIDGYYHFRDAAAFRRDRRKDVDLQRTGYLIYRVLADDVVARMEEILENLERLIDTRRLQLAGQETPNGNR
jgi:hypothetical protein